ncbi:MAG: DEAD/DEAH box helicase [Leadbetterella sp.]|nr:DEAD/DEAH box helicase [Leadbetterella sp.]
MIREDREEALYFFNDLQNIYGYDAPQIAYFPASFKREAGEVENANVIQRSALLTRFQSREPLLIVTYPEALSEKVVSKKTLVAHTLKIKVGDTLDLNFVTELLVSYHFEKTDFVYEPGQFAVRGGILDVFSYSDDVPYRIELFGDEVESIRAFEAESQLSTKTGEISITPNLRERFAIEETVPFFHFLPEDSLMVFNDLGFILDRVQSHYGRVERAYEESRAGDINLSIRPEVSHIDEKGVRKGVLAYKSLELGKKGYFKEAVVFTFESRPQPSFNKDFNLLNQDLTENQALGYTVFLASDSLKQLNRLETIFAEINPRFKFTPLSANLREGFIDVQNKVLVYTDHQIFERLNRYREKDRFSKSKALTLKELKSLQPGDYVTHVDYGIGRFAGMETIDVGGKKQEAVRLVYRDNDLLYVNIHSLHKIAKYSGKEGEPPAMSKLGSGEWETRKSRVKRQVKDIAKELIALYAKRREAPGFAFSEDNYMQIELESSFMYEDTPDQAAATTKVKGDMEKPYPMDRLVCGDVGFGKTEVAIRAAFKAVTDSKQVAVLVPTTILALQHYKTFSERLENFPVRIEFVSRLKSTAEINGTLKELTEGKNRHHHRHPPFGEQRCKVQRPRAARGR